MSENLEVNATALPATEPTGLAPRSVRSKLLAELPQLYLEFESTEAVPALETIFLGSGGPIAAAAARGLTDFAISGAVHSTPTRLSDTYSTVLRVPVPKESVSANTDKGMTVNFDNRSKLLVSSSRAGAGINGSLVTTVAGQGAIYLSDLFRAATGSTQVPLQYANWQAHSSVVAAANVRLIDDDGRRYNVHFNENKQRDAALKAAEDVVSSWANGAWQMRQESMRYPHSPTLTKAVARVPCGINDSGALPPFQAFIYYETSPTLTRPYRPQVSTSFIMWSTLGCRTRGRRSTQWWRTPCISTSNSLQRTLLSF